MPQTGPSLSVGHRPSPH